MDRVGTRLRAIQWQGRKAVDAEFRRFGIQVEAAILRRIEVRNGREVLTPAGLAYAMRDIRVLAFGMTPRLRRIIEASLNETDAMARET
jgi:hypothetical protein